jgi:hypothetical protein
MLNKVKSRNNAFGITSAGKKIIILSISLCFCVFMGKSFAQQTPGVKITPATTPPIKVYEKPQIKKQIVLPVDSKPTLLPTFETTITTVQWGGQRWWSDGINGYSEAIVTMQFNKDKTVSWSKQGLEVVAPTPGTYSISNNSITINFSYAPYTYTLQGAYNAATGEITGTYTLVKAPFVNAPSYYIEGTITGTFTLVKK